MITTQAHKTSSNLSIDRETSASPTSNKLEIEKTSTACSRANQDTKNDLISVESTTNTIRILTSEEDNTGLRIEDRG
jgi:hypothetical protein